MNDKEKNKEDEDKNGEINKNENDIVYNISTMDKKENLMKQTGAIPKIKNVITNGVSSNKVNKLINNCNNSIKSGESSNNKVNGFVENDKMGHLYLNGDNLSDEVYAGPSNETKSSDSFSNSASESDVSSDTGNDELSYCDDYCIYTYKGDIADLPRSFMNLDQENENGSQAGSRGSSPEMDFLEMDFDPGPSNDIESDNSSLNIDLDEQEHEHDDESNNFNRNDHEKTFNDQKNDNSTNLNTFDNKDEVVVIKSNNSNNVVEKAQNAKIPFSKSEDSIKKINKEPEPCCSKSESNIFVKNYSRQNDLSQLKLLSNVKLEQKSSIYNDPWIPKTPSQRTRATKLFDDLRNHHSSGGDLNENLVTNNSDLNSSSSLYHSTMEKTLFLDKQPSNVESFINKTMIWTEQEAALKQTTQIATSACGATAVINVLKALDYEIPSNERVLECVQTRQRLNNSPLLKFLQSRSVAGSTHQDIISSLEELTENQLYARFFHTYPERYINLSLWLSHWIELGAVPIATLNLQRTFGNGIIPDAWHHSMIFGVGPNGIYLTNPLERVDEGVLWHQLTSDSELLIRREDVISRFDSNSLNEMKAFQDVRWRRFNVVGQVANVVREHRLKSKILSRTHVVIPAIYEAGITLVIDVNNPACEILRTCPDLPVYFPSV